MLIAAVIAFGFGVWLAKDDAHRVFASFALVTIGSVLIGGWIVLLASHGYTGADPTDDDEDDPGGAPGS